jgi:hypothetical protein
MGSEGGLINTDADLRALHQAGLAVTADAEALYINKGFVGLKGRVSMVPYYFSLGTITDELTVILNEESIPEDPLCAGCSTALDSWHWATSRKVRSQG